MLLQAVNFTGYRLIRRTLFTRAEKNEARGGDTCPVLSYAYYLQAHATRATFYLDFKKS